MLVAIVTPYHDSKTLHWLQECIESVRRQSYKECIHVLVGDGFQAMDLPIHDRLHTIHLSHNIGDYGDSPRALGAIYAYAQGADAVAFLDADNWYEINHIESLIDIHKHTGAQVITCYRQLADLNGKILGICPDSDGLSFCDTGCMLFTKDSSEIATSWWTIPKAYHALDDRVIWDRVLSKKYSIACSKHASFVYRTAFIHHYKMFNQIPLDGTKSGKEIGRLHHTMNLLEARAREIAPQLMIKI